MEKTLRLVAEMTAPLDMPHRQLMVPSIVRNVLIKLGIYHVRESVVGDNILRGVSGGEKKRVTIAEIFVSRARCLLLDDYTRGLDSSAALEITEILRTLTNASGISCAATMSVLGKKQEENCSAWVLL